MILPKSLEDLIIALGTLPGVGRRSAERFAYNLLRSDEAKAYKLANALNNLHNGIDYCPITFALIDKEQKISPLYSDSKRDKATIAVVEDAFDIVAIENTGQYHGTYHVLGGLISPIDGISPEHLHISDLIKRIETDKVEEVILAVSSNVEGDLTANYIIDKIRPLKLKLTRLARGLPVGLDLEYADHLTLGRALEGRQVL